jgi:uracil-DNA glycosylase family 4
MPEDRPDIMFVCEAPGPDENEQGVCLVGKAGDMFDTFVGQYLDGYSWYANNSVRCFPGWKNNGEFEKPKSGTKNNPGPLRLCRSYLEEEIEYLKPRLLVPMGAHAIATVCGLPANRCKVGKMAGTIQPTEWGIPAMPMHHPSWVCRNVTGNLPVWTSLWQRMIRHLKGENEQVAGKWEWLGDEQIRDFYREQSRGPIRSPTHFVAFDFETTGFSPRLCDFRMVGYALGPDVAVVHPLHERWQQTLCRDFLKQMPRLGAHHSIFDLEWAFARWGVSPGGLLIDTKALAFMVNENFDMSLSELTKAYLPNFPIWKHETELAQEEWNELPDEVVAQRCANDCMATYQLAKKLNSMLSPELIQFYIRVVEPGLKTVARMKARGVKVDDDLLATLLTEGQEKMETMTLEVEAHPDMRDFLLSEQKRLEAKNPQRLNLNSTQMKARFLKHVGVTPNKKKEAQADSPGLISTSKEVLAPRQDEHELIPRFLEYDKSKHKVTHQHRPLLAIVDRGGLAHPGYNYMGATYEGEGRGTVTLRLSSARGKGKPGETTDYFNWMNPDKSLRKVFVSRFPGGKLVMPDYSGVEIRIAASIAPEPVWIQNVLDGVDHHQNTADECTEALNIPVSRDSGKTINFGVLYGAKQAKIALELMENDPTLSYTAAYRLADQLLGVFWDVHAGLRAYQTRCRMQALQEMKVDGIFPFTLHMDADEIIDPKKKPHALNRAGNFPIQNAGGIITFWAMTLVDNAIERAGLDALTIGQLHDSIIVDAPRDEVDEVRKIMRHWMVDFMNKELEAWMKVPLEIEFTVGRTMAGPIISGRPR